MVAMVRPALMLGITLYLNAHAHSEQWQQLQQQPLQLAPPTQDSHPVYILDTTCAAQSTAILLGRALNKIGYTPHRPYDATVGRRGQTGPRSSLPPNTYTCLSVQGTDYIHLARQSPESRFMTHGVGDSATGLGNDTVGRRWQEMRQFFSQWPHLSQLLIIDVYAPEQAKQAENWERICVFLGLGYSMVERMGLWLLP